MPRASLVVIAATLPMFNIPEAGLLLILAVDHFLDMGRSATNVVGNAVASVGGGEVGGRARPARAADDRAAPRRCRHGPRSRSVGDPGAGSVAADRRADELSPRAAAAQA